MIKPGKPFIFGVCAGVALFGLPGYPVSAMITFERLIEPVIRGMTYIKSPRGEKVMAEAGKRVYSARGRYEFMPVKLEDVDGKLHALPVPGGSGAIKTLIDLDGYIAIEEEVEIIESGDTLCVVKKR